MTKEIKNNLSSFILKCAFVFNSLWLSSWTDSLLTPPPHPTHPRCFSLQLVESGKSFWAQAARTQHTQAGTAFFCFYCFIKTVRRLKRLKMHSSLDQQRYRHKMNSVKGQVFEHLPIRSSKAPQYHIVNPEHLPIWRKHLWSHSLTTTLPKGHKKYFSL